MQDNWRTHFGVDIVNGSAGHELKLGERTLVGTVLASRIGRGAMANLQTASRFYRSGESSTGRRHQLQCCDSSISSRQSRVGCCPRQEATSLWRTVSSVCFNGRTMRSTVDWTNRPSLICLSQEISSVIFSPLNSDEVREIIDDAIEFDKFTGPMEEMLLTAGKQTNKLRCQHCRPAIGRWICRQRTQDICKTDPDMVNARNTYVASRSIQLHRCLRRHRTRFKSRWARC